MNKIILLSVSILLAFNSSAQTDLFTNLSQFGIGSSLADVGQSVTYDSESNIIVFGSFSDDMDFDPTEAVEDKNPLGTPDLFLAKYQQDGSLLWVMNMGRISLNDGLSANGIVVDSDDNILVSGSFSSNINFNPLGDPEVKSSNGGKDAFLAKYNTNGELQWVNTFGSLFFEFGARIAVDSDDNILFGIRYNGDVDADPSENEVLLNPQAGGTDAAVVKYDSDGNYIWHFEISTADNDNITALASASDGRVAVGATINGSLSGIPTSDMKLIVLDSNGELSFEYNYDNYDNYNAISSFVFTAEDNSLYVSGRIQGDTDFDPSETEELIIEPLFADPFFAKYDLDDNSLIWAKYIRGSGIEDFTVGTIIIDDTFIAIGSFEDVATFIPGDFDSQLESAGGIDIYMAAYDKDNGEFVDAQIFGGAGSELATGAHFKSTGEVVVTGAFTNSLSLNPDGNVVSANGNTDIFFAEFYFEDNIIIDGVDSKFAESEVLVYPIPASDELNLEVQIATAGDLEIKIFSIVGQVVKQASYVNANGIKRIDITDLNAGVYIMELNLNGERVSKRFVKK